MANSLLDAQEFFLRLPAVAEKAAQLSINQAAQRGGLKLIKNEILDEIRFPPDYLSGNRLGVTKKAKQGDLEAVITARNQPTSLARFAQGTALGSRARVGVRVQVGAKSGARILKTAWLTKLNNNNIGLAIRLKPGQTLFNRDKPVTNWLVPGSVALLYGPSVNQVFRHVSEDVSEPIANMVAQEFFRQFERLANQ